MVKKAQAQKSSKKDDKSKQIKKDTNTKATKKTSVKAVGPMKVAAAKDKSSNLLELGLLCDSTSSMGTWIERAKTTLKEIITNVV